MGERLRSCISSPDVTSRIAVLGWPVTAAGSRVDNSRIEAAVHVRQDLEYTDATGTTVVTRPKV
ncbi:hypothetical protein GCM10017577_74770 [Pseudonocardia halophobica]|uniref:Uncharacterized protein n=1 Tax=Pseudonocardia halophobica TaxID=29401 RepID=A0A9W6P223_9PSEU|nr:hypothetical protein GCM10017577_74770 [Pseudonocardia halophobica]